MLVHDTLKDGFRILHRRVRKDGLKLSQVNRTVAVFVNGIHEPINFRGRERSQVQGQQTVPELLSINDVILVGVEATEDVLRGHAVLLHPRPQNVNHIVGYKHDATGRTGAWLVVKQFTAGPTLPALLLACQSGVAFWADFGIQWDDGLARATRGHLRCVVAHGEPCAWVIKERYNHSRDSTRH